MYLIYIKLFNNQTLPNSAIHFSYLSKGTAWAEDFVLSSARPKSSFVTGPGVAMPRGSAYTLQLMFSKEVAASMSFISLLNGFIAASLQTRRISLPL